MKTCRRCSECADSEHHWIEDYDDVTDTEYGCKHCQIRGVECGQCWGEGIKPGTDDENCAKCSGHGVVVAHNGN